MTDEQLTIVMVPDGALGEECQTVAVAWSRAGLLQPSVWLTPSQVSDHGQGPAEVVATQVSGDDVDEADLFTLVGRRRLSLVRLVIVHLGVAEPQDDAGLDAAASRLSDLLHSALPLATATDRGTDLHRVKLVVPATGVTSVPSSVLRPDWEVNAVVSPEDRPDVDRASVFVREDSNYVGHVVSAVCAVGGLWDGMPAGALDSVTSDSTTTEGWLHVLRPTVRAILADDRAERLLDQAVTTVSQADVVDYIEWGRRAARPAEVVTRAAGALLGSRHWATPEPVGLATSRREQRAAGEVVGKALVYNLRLFGTGWAWMLRSGERSIEHMLTAQLVGHESDVVVVLRPEGPAAIAAQSRAQQEASDVNVGELLRSEGLEVNLPDPEAWRDLRRLAFALVDGDELPEGVRNRGSTKLIEVVPRSGVVPGPDDVRTSATGDTIGLVDVLAFREDTKRLEAAAEAERDAEASAGGSQDGSTKKGTSDSTAAASARARLAKAREWESRRRDSLLWLLAGHLADRLEAARTRRDFLEHMPAPTTDEAADALTKAFRRLVATWRTSGILALAGVAWLLWALLSGDSEPRALLAPAAAGLVVLTLVVAWANHRYFKADLRFRRQSAEAANRRRAAAEELVTQRRNVSWLGSRYRGLMMWAPILAELIHHPWGEVSHTEVSIPEQEIDRLPAAVALGVRAEAGAETFGSQVVTDAINVLAPPGYLGRLWHEVLDDFLLDTGRSPATGASELDSDELETHASPRGELLQYVQDEHARSAISARSLTRIHDAVQDGEVRLPAMQVRRLGRYSDGLTPTDDEFYRASLKSATPFTTDLWTPDGLQQAKHLLQKSMVWSPVHDEGIPSSVELLPTRGRTSVRVDLSGRCYVEHVVVFRTDERPAPSQTWTSDDLDIFN